MARVAYRVRRRLLPAAIGLVLAVSGCGGGAVSVRSNFTGPPLGPTVPSAPATPAPSAPQGMYAAGDGSVVLAVIIAMMLFDGVSWATQRIRQAFADPEAPAVTTQPAAPAPGPVVRPPHRSWVFSYP